MKKNLASRLLQIILVFALVVTSIVVTPSDAKAATVNNLTTATKADLAGAKTEKYLYKNILKMLLMFMQILVMNY